MASFNVRRRYVYGGFLLLLVCSIVSVSSVNGWMDAVEHFYYDLWHQVTGHRADAEHVIIVALDDQSLVENRDEPLAFWGPHFARAIEVLRKAGAVVIGVDFLFSVSAESWLSRLEAEHSELSRTYDIPLRLQLFAGRVVLIGMLAGATRGKHEILLPVQDYLFSLPGGLNDIGLANLYLDDDQSIRRFVPALFEEGILPRQTLAVMLAQRAANGQELFSTATIETPQHIGYIGPPGTVPRISFSRLLREGAENDPDVRKVNQKVVIISAEHAGNYDTHLTPYAQRIVRGKKAMMTGAEIHANIIETLFSGNYPRPVNGLTRFVWMIAITALGMVLFLRSDPLTGAGILLILVLAVATASCILFLNHLIFPAGSIQIALGLSYIGTIGIRLTQEEKNLSHMQNVLSPYVSDEVMTEVLASGQLPDLGGENRTVTVLFSDIRSFTSISEKLASDEVVEMLNEYFGRVCEPIMNAGGMVDKFIGDAVMAIFGAPVSYSDHAKRCMRTALRIVDIAENFQEWMDMKFPDRDLPAFHVGIGIHTGEAVIGNIGSKKRMGYTAIGDSVNTASRLEGQCKELGWTIVASRSACESAGSAIVTGREDTVTIRGREGRIDVFEITGMA